MRVQNIGSQPNQSLTEYCVGVATASCTYPGIAQCFAVAGWTQSKIIGVHVSPGFTKDEMDAAFGFLQALGGDTVMHWYIVGPFQEHFSVAKAQWHSERDIKKSFKKHLTNPAAKHLILDATAERNTLRPAEPGITIPSRVSAIDVRVVVNGITMAFEYGTRHRGVTTWTGFDLTKFRQF